MNKSYKVGKKYKLCMVLVTLPIFFAVLFVVSLIGVNLLGNSIGSMATFLTYMLFTIPYGCPIPCSAAAVFGLVIARSLDRDGVDISNIRKLGFIGIGCMVALMLFVGALVLVGMAQ